MVDTIIVGKCLGVSFLAAVGSGVDQLYDHRFLYRCLKDCDRWRRSSARGITRNEKVRGECGWLSAVFAVVCDDGRGALCMNILQWMNTPEDIIQGAYDYIFCDLPWNSGHLPL